SGLPGDVLDLRVLVQSEPAALTAEPALLEAAEGRVDHVDAVIDPHDAGADALRERERSGGVLPVDRAAEAVRRRVRDADRVVVVAERDHGYDGAEDLLLRDADVVRDVAEDRRLEEVPARQVLRPAAAVREDGALALPGLDVLLDLPAPLVPDHR